MRTSVTPARSSRPIRIRASRAAVKGQTQVTHSAALLFWLTGLRPTRVTAFCESFELDVDLCDSVAVRFEGGAIGTVGSTGAVPPGHAEVLEYRLFGPNGYVTFDVMEGRTSFHEADGAVEELTLEFLDAMYRPVCAGGAPVEV